MLALYGLQDVLKSAYLLARQACPAFSPFDSQHLRAGYFAFLKGTQFKRLKLDREQPFVIDPCENDAFANIFSAGALNDLNQANVIGPQYTGGQFVEKLTFASDALGSLLDLDDDLGVAFDLVVHSIVIRSSKREDGRPASHGGSSSSSIGVIWLSVDECVSRLDIWEMYVHELTHHLLFIDELNHSHFNYDLVKLRENFAISAILKRARPLDKVVHSIAVGAEILSARRKYLSSDKRTLMHPTSGELAADILASARSVAKLPALSDLLTERARNIIARSEAIAEEEFQISDVA